MMAGEKTCFIIMPITMPEHMVDKYRDGEEHFIHVLESLFKPAVEKAGYTAIPPTAEGSVLIHENIITNLETTDMVLYDMSCLNANVFFEFGIRTALNKPVCVVKDDIKIDVPFDTKILQYLEYKSSLDGWNQNKQIEELSRHIKTAGEKSAGINNLWKNFGITKAAKPSTVREGENIELENLALEVKAMRQAIEKPKLLKTEKPATIKEYSPPELPVTILQELRGMLRTIRSGVDINGVEVSGINIDVHYSGNLEDRFKDLIGSFLYSKGFREIGFRQQEE